MCTDRYLSNRDVRTADPSAYNSDPQNILDLRTGSMDDENLRMWTDIPR